MEQIEKSLTFHHHSIELPGGELTRPDTPLLADSGKMQSVKRILDFIFANRNARAVNVIDLGCLEGGTTAEFARWGYEVLGLEARESNLKRCRYVAERLRLPNLRFVKDNMLNVEAYGEFDVVYASGVLYHVADPEAFLNILGKVTKTVLVLNTHYATDPPPAKFEARLSEMTQHKGRRGQWFSEWPETLNVKQIEKRRKSAYDTHRAFWLAKEELLDAMQKAGFPLIFEQFDQLKNIKEGYVRRLGFARGSFVGLKMR